MTTHPIIDNPFTLSFGRKPNEYISRLAQTELIIDSFSGANPVTQAYMLSGIRGSGKTVLLTEIADRLREQKWVVVDLNPTVDCCTALHQNYIIPPASVKSSSRRG